MESVATTNQTYLIGAKSYLGSFFSKTSQWVCKNCFMVGGLTTVYGISLKADLIQAPIMNIFPALSNVALILGIVLTGLGIITKFIEVKKLFKK
jgi:hypothetical protein